MYKNSHCSRFSCRTKLFGTFEKSVLLKTAVLKTVQLKDLLYYVIIPSYLRILDSTSSLHSTIASYDHYIFLLPWCTTQQEVCVSRTDDLGGRYIYYMGNSLLYTSSIVVKTQVMAAAGDASFLLLPLSLEKLLLYLNSMPQWARPLRSCQSSYLK